MESSRPQKIPNPVPPAGKTNGKPPEGWGGKIFVPFGSQHGTWVRLVRRGTVAALGMTGFVSPVDRPKAPFLSKVLSKPAPMRSNTTPTPPRMTVLGFGE